MLIDSHLDLAYNAVALGADLTLSLEALRDSPYGRAAIARRETPTVSLPALRDADVRIALATIFAQAQTKAFGTPGPIYSTPDEASAQGWAQMRYYRQLEQRGEVAIVRSRSDLEAAVAAPARPSLVLLMEGADPVRDAGELQQWWNAGLRVVGLSWSATRYAGGTGAPGPLTPAGVELLDEMGRLGIGLDLSHLAEMSAWQALERFSGPVCASHSNCQAFVPTDRQLSDVLIRSIAERDGVVGVVIYNRFLVDGWTPGQPKSAVTLADVVRHIEHICELAGDSRHVGIGSDFDGGLGVESIPAELHDITDLHLIGSALRDAGWREDEVDGVLGGNWAAWLGRALPES